MRTVEVKVAGPGAGQAAEQDGNQNGRAYPEHAMNCPSLLS
jgi:hypothetical protein